MDQFLEVFQKYAVYTGRSRRREYWMFFLINLVIVYGIMILGALLNVKPVASIIVLIYNLAALSPSFAVAIRRLHDTDHSGWWTLAIFYNIILLAREGTKGDNKYGPDPKADAV